MTALLLDSGAEVDARTTARETPLHFATEGGHTAVIKLLLEAGAAADSSDALGRTPLHRHLGARSRRKEIVVLLLAMNSFSFTALTPVGHPTR